MQKTRVYMIARELNLTSKELLEKLEELDIKVTNHMSSLTEEEAESIIELLGEDKQGKKKPSKEEKRSEEKESTTKKHGEQHRQSSPKQGQAGKDSKAGRKDFEKPQENDRREMKKQQPQGDRSLDKKSHDGKAREDRTTDRPGFKKDKDQKNQDKYKKITTESRDGSQKRESTQDKSGKQGKPGKHQDHRKPMDQKQGAKPEHKQVHEQESKPEQVKEPVKTPSVEPEDTGILVVGDTIVVGELANKLGVAASEIIMKIMKLGIMANINQEIKFETAEKIAMDYEVLLEREEVPEEEEDIIIEEDDAEDLKPRPPIVTVMGHVDHGKTSLLDAIRNTRVIDKEAGGITQHIGAYEVVVQDKKVVFLDTPGHEAFTEMRSRGAQVTDIAILVVAADDGIMPQTVEAINHCRAAEVPIIVAINKIDKPGANVDRVRQELSEKGLLVEDWGGDVIDVAVSAKAGTNIDSLLEMILLVAEMEELKANPDRAAVGTVVEANLDKGRGPVATVIVANGTLKVGDPIVAGAAYGKIRAMINDNGKRIKKAPPSTPVEILGLSEVPNAGDQFVVLSSDKAVRLLGEKRKAKIRDEQMKASSKISLEDLFEKMQHGEIKELNIIVKADVQGSVEAVRQSIEKLSNEEVSVRVIHGGVGAITESDIMLASASNAIIIGFNVRPSTGAVSLVEREKVDMRTYRIIYEAIEDIEKAMKGMLDPEFVEEDLGRAEVRMPFKVPNAGVVAGSYVTSGKIQRSAKVRLVRDGIVIYEGTIDSLRRFKDDVKEVATGYECGIGLTNYNDIKEGDVIEAYIIKEIKRV